VAVKAYPVTAWLAVQASSLRSWRAHHHQPREKYAAVMLMHTLLTIA